VVERVLELYRGPLLPAAEGAWAESARGQLRGQLARFLHTATRQLEDLGERATAAALALRAPKADPDLALRPAATATA